MTSDVEQRARIHAALGDPNRLAIVDELTRSDRTPGQLSRQLGLGSNLLSHHLDLLDAVGLIERVSSAGDRRRRYVRLLHAPLADLAPARPAQELGSVLFVCTHNSARSQLAAALWTRRTGRPADSAGTDPADQVHPGAVAAAARHGLDLTGATPTVLADALDDGRAAGRGGGDRLTHGVTVVVTVCDRANEELCSPAGWWHWSTPDPVAAGTPAAFDATVAALDHRITSLPRPVKGPR